MANAAVTIGGIAAGIAIAAFGIAQVPGWVQSAQDAAAINDLAMISAAQATSATLNGEYAGKISSLQDGDLGVSFTVPEGRIKHLSVRGDNWCGVVISDTGRFFGASAEKPEPVGARTLGLAIANACGGGGAAGPKPK